MTPEKRYERYEPITIRAAARVLWLRRAGVITAAEAEFYLEELTSMDRYSGYRSRSGLERVARQRLGPRRSEGFHREGPQREVSEEFDLGHSSGGDPGI